MRVLLLENIHKIAKEKLEDYGFEVDLLEYSPAKEDMKELFAKYDIIGIRSKTKITKDIIAENSHLLAIGCFCIGTNQVDLDAAKEAGIAVFNAPHSNTRSVAELVIAEMIALARQLGDRSALAHQGKWLKSAVGSNEIRGKVLGIVGYGHIGSQVSVLAEAFGLTVLFYDITKKLSLGNAHQVDSLEELFSKSDFVTLHVPETPETKNMIGKNEFSQMKCTAHFINASRGSVVVIEDLVAALRNKQIAGAAIDVFPKEPASNKDRFTSELQGVENVILTPHIGGSTEEAQVAIGQEVADSLYRFSKFGSTEGSVNLPNINAPVKANSKRMTNIHVNKPGVLGEINSIISASGANIEGQYLGTDEKVGYLVVDVQADMVKDLTLEIKKLDRCILTRQL